MTRPGWLTPTAGATVIAAAALTAAAQTVTPLALSEWLRPKPPAAEVREAARARIAALRHARRTQAALHPAGRWQSRRAGHEARPWRAQLARDTETGALTGRIVVVGSGLLSDGAVIGAIDGTRVSGAISERGARVATFTGSVFTGGMSGTYETASGDTGTWSVPDTALASR